MTAIPPPVDPKRPAADRHVEHIEVHVYHHFPDGPIPLAIVEIANVLLGQARNPAISAILTIGAKPAMTTAKVNVDTTNEVATLQWVDDHGDTDALKPGDVNVEYTSSAPDVLTVDPDGAIHVLHEGTATVGVAITHTDGSPWGEAVEPVDVTVEAGAAVGARLSVAEGTGATPTGDTGTGDTGTGEPTPQPETPTPGDGTETTTAETTTTETTDTGTTDAPAAPTADGGAVQETPVPGEAGPS